MPELYLETGYHHFPSHSFFHHIICNHSPISLTATYLSQLIGYFYVWMYISRCYGEGSLRHDTANTEMKVLLQKGFVILQLLKLSLNALYTGNCFLPDQKCNGCGLRDCIIPGSWTFVEVVIL